MLSLLAKEDLADLRAEGLEPSDEDIVRLNALALRISDGPETTAYNAPRWALAGGVVIHEPTMAALLWYAYAKEFMDDEAAADWLFAFACANGRRPGYLANLRDPEEIQCALGVFLGNCAATRPEIDRAVDYVTYRETETAEPTEKAKRRAIGETANDREARNAKSLERYFLSAAAETKLTFTDLLAQTPSRLSNLIWELHVVAGEKLTRTSGKAHADYLSTLAAIRARLEDERLLAAENANPDLSAPAEKEAE